MKDPDPLAGVYTSVCDGKARAVQDIPEDFLDQNTKVVTKLLDADLIYRCDKCGHEFWVDRSWRAQMQACWLVKAQHATVSYRFPKVLACMRAFAHVPTRPTKIIVTNQRACDDMLLDTE